MFHPNFRFLAFLNYTVNKIIFLPHLFNLLLIFRNKKDSSYLNELPLFGLGVRKNNWVSWIRTSAY